MSESYDVVIGLEIHVQLSTASKIFSGASTAFGAPPNSQACAVDLGLPGVLPVVNERVFEKAVRFGLGVGATINRESRFDRKNYFYPDLPKGYQITQLEKPIVEFGTVAIELEDGSSKTIRLTRAHLEEDAGKSLHEDFHGMTGIDLNRAGTPLLEIVSEPDLRSAAEAVAYARKIHQLVTYLDVSDGNMAEGSLRCDANVSLRPAGTNTLGTRTETKNVNSFRFLERAINHEIERQGKILRAGGRIDQETRLYDPDRDETRPMRSKETSMDYRYFPEPDLLPVVIDDAWVEAIAGTMPELPGARCERYEALGLTQDDAALLSGTRALADFFDATVARCDDPRQAANWVRGDLLGQLNREELDITAAPISAEQVGDIILRIQDGTISGKLAKTVFASAWDSTLTIDEIIAAEGLEQVSGAAAIEPIVDQVIADNPKQVEQFRAGKDKVLGFFVGQVMKASQGKANPAEVNQLVRDKLTG